MESNICHPELKPEHSVVLAYTDLEKVEEIDRYYINLMKELRNSQQLNEEEKAGQRAFLHKHWEREVGPFLRLWRVRLYQPVD